MKILGFVGSNRKNGSTAWAVEQILETAKTQGAETEIFYSGSLNISPCKGCLGCVASGNCIIEDDMSMIYRALSQADTLVVGTPIYMGQMSGSTKVFLDRLFACIKPRFSPNYREEYGGKKLVLVVTQGNPNVELFKEYIDYTEKTFRLLDFDVQAVQIIAGTRAVSADTNPAYVDALTNIGRKLVDSSK